MEINESYASLRAMISRFLYQIPSEVGSKGSIDGDLVRLSDVFGYDMGDIQSVLDSNWDSGMGMKANNERIMSEHFPEIYKVWDNYRRAMSRRRPDDVLGLYTFASVSLSKRRAFMYGDSVVLGRWSNGYFKPAHFCPANMREGVEMLKELAKYDNIIFAVTDDLGPMLVKLGLYGNDQSRIPMFFRNRMVMKQVYTTDRELLAQVLERFTPEQIKGLASDYHYKDIRDDVRMKNRYGDIEIGTNVDKNRVPMNNPAGRNRNWKQDLRIESVVRGVINEVVDGVKASGRLRGRDWNEERGRRITAQKAHKAKRQAEREERIRKLNDGRAKRKAQVIRNKASRSRVGSEDYNAYIEFLRNTAQLIINGSIPCYVIEDDFDKMLRLGFMSPAQVSAVYSRLGYGNV